MKLFKTTIKTEIKELIGQKALLSILFIGILILDALGAIFPEYLDRHVTLFIPIPLIFVIHILNARKKDKLFLLSLVFHFLGIYYFNNPYEAYNALGIVFHTIAFFIYAFILFKHYQITSLKRVLKFAFAIVILVSIPTVIYSDGMSKMLVLQETIVYVFSVTLFIFSASVLYMNSKTKTNRFLLLATISILMSSYFQGYNLFMKKNDFLEFFAVIFFNLTHYFMCWYLIAKSRRNVGVG